MIKVKTFIQALTVISLDVEKGKRFFNDKRLTQAEKTILKCFLYLRDNNSQLVIDTLTDLSTADPVVESQKCLFLGIAYNNQTDYLNAISNLESSWKLLQGQGAPQLEFVTINNLFIVHVNLRDEKGMKVNLERLQKMKAYSHNSKVSILRAEFNYYSITNQFENAAKSLEKIEHEKAEMIESQVTSYLVDKFKFYVKTENFDCCQDTINEMKSYRKFQLTSNYNYMKLLLENLVKNKTLYVKDSDFKDSPVLFYEIKVIQMLEESNIPKAQEYWQKLTENSPDLYGKEFLNFKGDKCLFSLCLAKHANVVNVLNLKKLELPTSKMDALLKLLQEAKAPLHQQFLYEILWEEIPENKSDVSKLTQMVSALRMKTGLNIKVKKSCYYIDKVAKAKTG